MDALPHIPEVQLTPSQKEAMTCPTCKKPKEWSGNKPGTAAVKKGAGFRAMSVKRGPGRPRTKPRDKRMVNFY